MSDQGARAQMPGGQPQTDSAPPGDIAQGESSSGWEVDDEFGAPWYRGSDLELAEEICDGLVGGHLFAVSTK
jgi:hypothetical protein